MSYRPCRSYRSSLLACVLAPLVVGTAACGASSDDDAATGGGSALSSEPASDLSPDAVDAAIAKLDRQRNGEPIGPFYADGSRLEGCWRNPAGNKLTDLQKAFYCSMPLEFRLCNTVVLLTVDESDVDGRYQGYVDCQGKVDGVFGSKKRFVYDEDVNAIYKGLFLNKVPLAASDTARVVVAAKPPFTSRSFTLILANIAAGLAKEAIELSVAGLTDLVADNERAQHDQAR